MPASTILAAEYFNSNHNQYAYDGDIVISGISGIKISFIKKKL